MQRVSLAKFFGCSPADLRDMEVQEIAAAHLLIDELIKAEKKGR